MHVLRNPWGKTVEEMMKARHDAADYIESGLTQRAADLPKAGENFKPCPLCGTLLPVQDLPDTANR